MNIDINLTRKQSVAWKYLNDQNTNEVLFGGAAGSAKTYLGCLWVTTMCLTYPGTRYLIGRTRLTTLRLTTVNTLLDLFSSFGFNSDTHYNYNQQHNVIRFTNGSEIVLKDLQYYPSDPEFDSLGSLEITGAFIDEASQVTEKCYEIVNSRIRYKLNEFNLTPKLLMTCNPSQNWLKRVFYLPSTEDNLKEYQKFIQATAYDNPFLPDSYIQSLNRLNEQTKQRLLLGNWDYTDEIGQLFTYDNILNTYNKEEPPTNGTFVMSVDVARFGKDKSVLTIAKDNVIVEISKHKGLDTNQLADVIKEKMRWYKIPPQRVVADADGLGAGVVDILKLKGFINNSRAQNNGNFTNLKSQCYFKLAELISEGKLSINIGDPNTFDELTEELLAIKEKNPDADKKKAIMSKDEMKALLGKSPDIADSLMMLMYFQLNKTTAKYAVHILK